MCIRDSTQLSSAINVGDPRAAIQLLRGFHDIENNAWRWTCLLYTSDAADERSSVDLGGRRIIKKKKQRKARGQEEHTTKTTRKLRYQEQKQ